MRRFAPIVLAAGIPLACGGNPKAASSPGDPPDAERAVVPEASTSAPTEASGSETTASDTKAATSDEGKSEFLLRDSGSAKAAHGATPSKIKATKSEAAMKFFVVDKEKGPIPGIVISLTAPDGTKYYTAETDAAGYSEVLVPVGKKYDLVYLSLGRKDIEASVPVTDEPNQNIKLTLRYKRWEAEGEDAPRFVLDGVQFDTGKATIRAESFPRLDSVVEYLTHKKSVRIEVSGHTDNVGNPKSNQELSERRAQAVRAYLVSKGIDGSRIQAVGYGDKRPIAPNDTEEGRQRNRRIEASEL